MNMVSEVDEQVCCLWHSVIRPGGEMELTHCAALPCVGLGKYTLKKRKQMSFKRAAEVLPAIHTVQDFSIKLHITNCAGL